MNLNDLATKYKTDKQSSEHNYTDMYSKLLSTIKVNSLLEIGLGSGASMKMWLEYFPNADIYCMEYFDEENKNVWNSASGNIEGLKLFRGDSTKQESWDIVPYDLDVIIDDGDHTPESQIATFMQAFPHVNKRGLYVIEDTHCNFEKRYTDKDVIYPWVYELIINQQTPGVNWGGNFWKARPWMNDIAKDIYSYHFYKSCIVFEKA